MTKYTEMVGIETTSRQLEGQIDPRLIELLAGVGDDGFRRYLEELRWPDEVVCPRCEGTSLHWLELRRKHHCRGCRYQFSTTAGTVFHRSHLSLEKWLVAVSLMLATVEGLPAKRLQELIGGSYKTAWFLEHRIRAAMGVALTTRAPDQVAAQATLRTLSNYRRQRRLGLAYFSAYWSEARWLDTNQASPTVFRDTVKALLDHPPLRFDDLVDVGGDSLGRLAA